MRLTQHRLLVGGAFALVLLASGCRQDMHNQPKYKPLKQSAFFDDGRTSRPLVADTVARGELKDDGLLHTGKAGTSFSEQLPHAATREMLLRGQQSFNIYCAPCHDRVGNGAGMIVQRGFKAPPTLHSDRLRSQPVGYFFEVISKGFGVMPGYSGQIGVEDRWAIVAYLRALQLSQHAKLADVPEDERAKLDQPPAPVPGAGGGGHHD